jgi:predicted kinase
MNYREAISSAHNESDVEQKLVYPLLTINKPIGLGFLSSEVRTKPDIRQLTIGKGKEQKLYYPDYVAIIAGFPVLVIEVKGPDEPLESAFREARLYANELNALYPSQINPVRKIICVNGREIWAGYADAIEAELKIPETDLDPSSRLFGNLIEFCSRDTLQTNITELTAKLIKRPFYLPTQLLGGYSVRNEEIGTNTFGASISLDYRHVFNPSSRSERALIVREAYIPSERRQRYVTPIDRMIRAAVPPSTSDARTIEDVKNPRELKEILEKDRSVLENQVLLLVGNVGSGKSTFIDYVREVALPRELIQQSEWVHINMNNAPLSLNHIYDWLCNQIIECLKNSQKGLDFDKLDSLNKLYSVELTRLKKGALSLIPEDTLEYKTRLADEIIRLQTNLVATATAFARYCASERGKLLIIVFDNCDKRVRDEQLFMFQAAQWVRKQFRSLIILPLRDETYDNHRLEPPLDTALKDLVFRIEPPQFSRVLAARIHLALRQMSRKGSAKNLSYILPNGIRVEYPATDQGFYLSSIFRSITQYDEYVRRIIIGLAGRDLRKAMEIFLEFCTSGHVGEDEIFKIRQSQGKYTLPFEVVAKVLLRINRRFYDGNYSFIKNLFWCNPEDSSPNHFTRLAILRWLLKHFKEKGPIGVRGYHPVFNLKRDLNGIGFGDKMVQRELLYLLSSGCILAEHLRIDTLDDQDLIKISPGGFVHIQLIEDPHYLAAVAEDTWYNEEDIAQRIALRIGDKGKHYESNTTLKNAEEIVSYLEQANQASNLFNGVLTNAVEIKNLVNIANIIQKTKYILSLEEKGNPWFKAEERFTVGDQYTGRVVAVKDFGILVDVAPNLTGLIHYKKVQDIIGQKPILNDEVIVQIERVNESAKRITLGFVGFASAIST